ncbi:MAG: hypothetical protein J7457_02915 [Roseiflexus sp.]|nr:hypothetical protein [Roseiflexus sp.]
MSAAGCATTSDVADFHQGCVSAARRPHLAAPQDGHSFDGAEVDEGMCRLCDLARWLAA